MVQLHDGVMSHAAARKLDRPGWSWRTEEPVPVAVAIQPEDVRSHVWSQALKELNDEVAGEVKAQSQLAQRLP